MSGRKRTAGPLYTRKKSPNGGISVKKTFILLLVLLMTVCPGMIAGGLCEEPEAKTSDMMRVVNCNEWVSLRERPDQESARLIKVPLNETVYHCSDYNEQFVRCEYKGMQGYILKKYLEELYLCLDWEQDGCRITAYHTYANGEESLTVTSFAGDGEPVWGYTTVAPGEWQYSQTMAFIGGTAQDPKIMVLNSQRGLTMLELWDGSEMWTLSRDTVFLGSGNSAATDDNGIMYIVGTEGPQPLAVSPNGEVLWQSHFDSEDVFWPYEIEPRMDDIVVRYASAEQAYGTGAFYEVILDMTGDVQSIELVTPG